MDADDPKTVEASALQEARAEAFGVRVRKACVEWRSAGHEITPGHFGVFRTSVTGKWRVMSEIHPDVCPIGAVILADDPGPDTPGDMAELLGLTEAEFRGFWRGFDLIPLPDGGELSFYSLGRALRFELFPEDAVVEARRHG